MDAGTDGGGGGLRGPVWPDLTLARWEDSRVTFQLWAQIVGKVRLALEPMINHWWQVPLYVSARGLTTSLMSAGAVGLEIEFDFVDHVLRLRTTRGEQRQVELRPRSVADFYGATLQALDELGTPVAIVAHPVEVPVTTPFAEDEEHRSYDPDALQRFWLALVQIDRVMTLFRSRFSGKVSPVHFFWGATDMAVTRFSGRPAPAHPGGVPYCPDFVQREAYNRELSSCGFWPGGSDEGSFYAYAYPQPDGFAEWPVGPDAASFDVELGEFLLPYAAVRKAEDPDALLLEFFQTSYEAAAELARWDRADLEVPGPGTPLGSPGHAGG